MSDTLIKALQNPALYPHPVIGFAVIQTHLSWVILTGLYAYKIKKPLNLGFQDFTTLEKRQHYCELELRYNREFAPDLYLDLWKITGSADAPALNGDGNVIEYAIRMHQFDQTQLLNHMAAENQLTSDIFVHIADSIAHAHQHQLGDTQSELGTPFAIKGPIDDNFTALHQLLTQPELLGKVETIQRWAQQQYERLLPLLMARKANGYIRPCHGDLHLGNIVLINDKPVIFDCIEFNESFRTIDVMNDIGFLTMDLQHWNLKPYSQLLINRYLEQTGDFEGAILLPFYQSYRAMVRAKVLAFQLKQTQDGKQQKTLQASIQSFIDRAFAYTRQSKPTLFVTVGPSGSGKTLYTSDLLLNTDTIRIRADSVRKQLFPNLQREQLYDPKTTQAVYLKLQEYAHKLLAQGISVIIDATCLKQWQRDLFIACANQIDAQIQLLIFEAPQTVLAQRIEHRLQSKHDISDANVDVLNQQLSQREPLSDIEKSLAIPIDSAQIDRLIARL